MMKKILSVCAAVLMLLPLAACRKQTPSQDQVRAICELSVMDCYYHNVAKFNKEKVQGILWWQKDRRFWIEYDGIVKLGIDASQVQIEGEGDHYTVTIPAAKVLSCTVDSDSLGQYIIDGSSAPVRVEDMTAAMQQAQQDMAETAANDPTLMREAQQRAKSLVENYFTTLGDAVKMPQTPRRTRRRRKRMRRVPRENEIICFAALWDAFWRCIERPFLFPAGRV